jgi:hypothetical protein
VFFGGYFTTSPLFQPVPITQRDESPAEPAWSSRISNVLMSDHTPLEGSKKFHCGSPSRLSENL